jgi:Serine carboxypeptidase
MSDNYDGLSFALAPNRFHSVTMEIVKRDPHKKINFQGMMVGNPYVDPFSNTLTQIQAFYQHGLLAKPLFDQWSAQCTLPDNYDGNVRQIIGPVSNLKGNYLTTSRRPFNATIGMPKIGSEYV